MYVNIHIKKVTQGHNKVRNRLIVTANCHASVTMIFLICSHTTRAQQTLDGERCLRKNAYERMVIDLFVYDSCDLTS